MTDFFSPSCMEYITEATLGKSVELRNEDERYVSRLLKSMCATGMAAFHQ